jgi:23S rRNA (cytidine1920-2'-O)/16S rRNA (cytidine1409-2'-O)-methyltransferase
MTSRLDEVLVARGLSPSRSRARDQVNRGCVTVNGIAARKPSQSVSDADKIAITDEGAHYVARSALKLLHALNHFKYSPHAKHCLDIGASTGGFTQVLLEHDAAHVTALDVGHGQLAPALAADPRVTSLEGTNIRDYSVPESIDFIAVDVSFISLRLALANVLPQIVSEAKLIALVKPQFEVGRERLPKDGVVKDPHLHKAVCVDMTSFLVGAGWQVSGIIASPIQGGDGNREFLVAAHKIR